MITSHNNNNFAIKFANGLTISVAFGAGNYCGRRNTNTRYNEPSKVETNTAEILIWDETNTAFECGAIGWLNADEIAKWISATQQATCITDLVIPL